MSVEFSSYGVALLIIQGLVILGLFRALRSVIERSDLSKATRSRIERLLPVGEAITALVYLLSAIPQVLKDDPEWSPIAVAIVLFGVGYVSWFAIRDYISGVFLRAGQVVRAGDKVTAGGHNGTVQRLGFRTLTLNTEDDQEVVLPYSSVSRTPIVRRVVGAQVVRHEIRLPRSRPLSDSAVGTLRRAAAFMHWSAVCPPVKVELRPDVVIVVVHLISAEYIASADSHLGRVWHELQSVESASKSELILAPPT